MKNVVLILAALFLSIAGIEAKNESFLLGTDSQQHIFVNNRILAKVNGKAISVIDVMKKMDMQFYKSYPQYTGSTPARFQFYQMSWKQALQEMIDKELILADAEEAKIQVSSGDVRQEMETVFGPNIILNLDKVGLTFEEAWKMIQEDITIRRTTYVRANAKALQKITPQKVKAAYEEYSKTNIKPEEWQYFVISIRDTDPTRAAEAANFAHRYLVEQKQPIENLAAAVTNISSLSSVKVTTSETFTHLEKDLSPAYKEVLATLTPDTYSAPIAQKSRTKKSSVFRIFYLKEHSLSGTIPFSKVENKLQELLVDDAVDKEIDAYLKKLRDHHHMQANQFEEFTPSDFQPFVLK